MALKIGKEVNLTFNKCEELAYKYYKDGKTSVPREIIESKLYSIRTLSLINILIKVFNELYKTFLAAASAIKQSQIDIVNSRIKDAYDNINLANNKIKEHRNLIKYYRHLWHQGIKELKFINEMAKEQSNMVKYYKRQHNSAKDRFNDILDLIDDLSNNFRKEELVEELMYASDERRYAFNDWQRSKVYLEEAHTMYADTKNRVAQQKAKINEYNALCAIKRSIIQDEKVRIKLLKEQKQLKENNLKIFDILLNLSFL